MLQLNLLPPTLKHDLSAQESNRHWRSSFIILLVFCLVGISGLLTTKIYLQRHADAVHAELLELQRRQAEDASTDITATTNTLNTTIKQLRTAVPALQYWDRDLLTVLHALPAGVRLTEVQVSAGHVFRVTGTADTRQTFLALDTALKNPATFSKVTTTSSASKRQDVPFDYTGTITTPLP